MLVHGCSAAANDLAEQVGYPVRTITGPGGHTSRYTDARMIEIYSAAAASVNQQMTAQLAAHGVRAVGLAGPALIRARRHDAIRAIRRRAPGHHPRRLLGHDHRHRRGRCCERCSARA